MRVSSPQQITVIAINHFRDLWKKMMISLLGRGFITWAVARDPELYDEALARFPRAMMLSFADPAPLARCARDSGLPLICQVHTSV